MLRPSRYDHSFVATSLRHIRKDAVTKGNSLPAAAEGLDFKLQARDRRDSLSSVTCLPSATPCVTGPSVTVSQNVVRGQQPGGQVRVIDDAQVSANGNITERGWFWANTWFRRVSLQRRCRR
jgi:hypothetical protein